MAVRRKLSRPLGNRRYRQLFLIVSEGRKTEVAYFTGLNIAHAVVQVKCLTPGERSDPASVLRRMKGWLAENAATWQAEDEAWLVVDRDSWPEARLQELAAWAAQQPGRGLALSNPKFEFWLLLHYEEGHRLKSASDCDQRLKRVMPQYDKVGLGRIHDMTEIAMQRARQKDIPPCTDWPRELGRTTVYRLVERILGVAGNPPPAVGRTNG